MENTFQHFSHLFILKLNYIFLGKSIFEIIQLYSYNWYSITTHWVTGKINSEISTLFTRLFRISAKERTLNMCKILSNLSSSKTLSSTLTVLLTLFSPCVLKCFYPVTWVLIPPPPLPFNTPKNAFVFAFSSLHFKSYA